MTNKNTPHAPKFIVLSGKKQVGKDTAAQIITNILAQERGHLRVVHSAFASSLKQMCIEVLGLKPEGVYGTDAQKNALCHIQWDGFPLEVRLKYSNEQYEFTCDVTGQTMYQVLPRGGSMTNREVLQVVGTDIFREIYHDVWAKAPFNRKWADYDVVILTDCRFENEKKVTEEAGGVIIRLERSTGLNDNHSSETALDNAAFKHLFRNDGTLEELEVFLRNVLKKEGII